MKKLFLALTLLCFLIFPSLTLVAQDETDAGWPVDTHNDDWIPVIEEFNGVEMVLVPPGCFMMGATDVQIEEAFTLCEPNGCRYSNFESAQPFQEVCFNDSFWIDRYEVDNGQITRFDETLFSNEGNWVDDGKPRENVSWLEANNFCALRSTRLPTEAEWEYSARGPDSLAFPWGNEFIADRVVYSNNSNETTAFVGSKAENVSWIGAFDMSGNLWEWVSTIYDSSLYPYPYNAEDGRESIDPKTILGLQRVLRGGSWRSDVSMLSTWYRTANNVIDSSDYWGFRCAYSQSIQ